LINSTTVTDPVISSSSCYLYIW